MSLAPFGALVITSIIVPQASFIGHLSGIIMGYFMAYVIYDITMNVWCTTALLVVLLLGRLVYCRTQCMSLRIMLVRRVPCATLIWLHPACIVCQ